MTRLLWLVLFASQVGYAGGFSLYTEGSAAEVGNFAAGSAAEAADASIGWYNPAGLVFLQKHQILLSGVAVVPRSTLSGVSTYMTGIFPAYQQSFDALKGGREAVVPALHYTYPLGTRAAVGFNVVSPFGLSSHWPAQSPLRYAATLTKMTAVNASPALSGLITDHLAVGLGLDVQWAQVFFDGVAGSPAGLQYLESIGAPVTPTFLDSSSSNQGTSIGIGFHGGVLGLFNDHHTRLGLNYQSAVQHQFRGYSVLTGRLADPELTNPDAIYSTPDLLSDTSLPSVLTLSLYQDVSARWALLGSVVYTGWSIEKTTELLNVAGFSTESSEQAPMNLIASQNYRDTWRFALGVNYHVNERWMLRVGGGYDETPTVDAARDVRLPDANRWALSIGTHYQATPSLGFDLGYTYLNAAHSSMINKTQVFDALNAVNVNAHAVSHVQLGGLQAVWTFDGEKRA